MTLKSICFAMALMSILMLAVSTWANNPTPTPVKEPPPTGTPGCWDCKATFDFDTGLSNVACVSGTGGSVCQISADGENWTCTISGDCGSSSTR